MNSRRGCSRAEPLLEMQVAQNGRFFWLQTKLDSV